MFNLYCKLLFCIFCGGGAVGTNSTLYVFFFFPCISFQILSNRNEAKNICFYGQEFETWTVKQKSEDPPTSNSSQCQCISYLNLAILILKWLLFELSYIFHTKIVIIITYLMVVVFIF